MRRLITLTIGMLARLVSTVASHYADWLMQQVLEREVDLDFVRDLKQFWRWLLAMLTQQLGGRHRMGGYEEEFAGGQLY